MYFFVNKKFYFWEIWSNDCNIGEEYKIFEKPVLDKNNTGAGCTFASSIASELVKGFSETEAVANAKVFVFESIKQSNGYGVVQYAK